MLPDEFGPPQAPRHRNPGTGPEVGPSDVSKPVPWGVPVGMVRSPLRFNRPLSATSSRKVRKSARVVSRSPVFPRSMTTTPTISPTCPADRIRGVRVTGSRFAPEGCNAGSPTKRCSRGVGSGSESGGLPRGSQKVEWKMCNHGSVILRKWVPKFTSFPSSPRNPAVRTASPV